MDRPHLVLARHGSTEWSGAPRRFTGRADIALTRDGEEDAVRLAAAMSLRRFPLVWSSPLRRALATAEAIATVSGAEVRLDDRLVEIDYGAWQGATVDEVCRRWPGTYARHQRHPLWATPDRGEPVASLLRRVAGFLIEHCDERTVLIVAHEGVLRAAMVVLGLLPLSGFCAFAPPCGGAVELLPGRRGYDLRVHNAPPSALRGLRRHGVPPEQRDGVLEVRGSLAAGGVTWTVR